MTAKDQEKHQRRKEILFSVHHQHVLHSNSFERVVLVLSRPGRQVREHLAQVYQFSSSKTLPMDTPSRKFLTLRLSLHNGLKPHQPLARPALVTLGNQKQCFGSGM
jgi:hypothetical protein